MKVYWLVLAVLGVWRVTHLLHAELGPWNCLERLRTAMESHLHTRLFGCFYCLSLWVAAPIAWFIGDTSREKLFLWLASSGGAILLQRMTAPAAPAATHYIEDPE